MKARRANKDREAVMSAGSSIPVQVFQRLSNGKLFGQVDTSFGDLAMVMGAATGTSGATMSAPFREGGGSVQQTLESGVATDRDVLLMEHLPTVRYLARRIHERLPQHVDLDDLISAGGAGVIDAFSKLDHTK